MSPSHYLPTAAFVVAVGSLFAPPLLGAMGVTPQTAPRESALVIETRPAPSLASLDGPISRPARRPLAQAEANQCAAPDTAASTKAPLPPALRTVVAELAPQLR